VLVGVGCLAYLLAAPLVWVHYHVLTVPLALYLLRPSDDGARGVAAWRPVLAAAAVVLVANRPLEAVIGKGFPALIAVSTNLGALLLFGLLMLEPKRSSSARPGGERAPAGVP